MGSAWIPGTVRELGPFRCSSVRLERAACCGLREEIAEILHVLFVRTTTIGDIIGSLRGLP